MSEEPTDNRVVRYAEECLGASPMDWDDLAIMVEDDFRNVGEPLGGRQWERCLQRRVEEGLVVLLRTR